jgi:hypothetical protein
MVWNQHDTKAILSASQERKRDSLLFCLRKTQTQKNINKPKKWYIMQKEHCTRDKEP